LRNADGSKGTQIYDGNYNENYTFNQGFYDYSHPAVRTFTPMLPVGMDTGLIFEATWVNNSPDTIPFGFTTRQEMFVTYFQYTNSLPGATAVKNISSDNSNLQIFPNPAANSVTIS